MNPNANGATWLNTRSAAARLDLSIKAFYHFLYAERSRPKPRLTVYWLNGTMRFKATEIDRCLEPEPVAAPLRVVAGAR